VLAVGLGTPAGRAEPVAGGYRVAGRWPFASGCQNAQWIAGHCVIHKDGAPVMSGARPMTRFVVLPAERWRIEETWQASGLAGTGSHHVVLDNVVVSEAETFELFHGPSCVPGPFAGAIMPFIGSIHAAVAPGIATRAITDLIAMAGSGRRQLFATADLRDSPVVQHELGRLGAGLRAARALMQVQAKALGIARLRARSMTSRILRKACRATPGSMRPAPMSPAAATRWADLAPCSTLTAAAALARHSRRAATCLRPGTVLRPRRRRDARLSPGRSDLRTIAPLDRAAARRACTTHARVVACAASCPPERIERSCHQRRSTTVLNSTTLDAKNRISSRCADELQAAISGCVALPGHQLYDVGSRVWNGAVRRRPAIVAFCKKPEDVQAAVRAAQRHGLPLSVRGGGHDWAGRALCDRGLVIDLTGMRDVAVDPQARVATVAGGARAKDVAAAAGAHDLAAALGNCGTVGMAGLTLGGGYGPLSGTCGLAADNLLGAEVVLADGRRVTTGPDAELDLLWALRGGGGNFGVATSLRVRLHPVRDMRVGSIIYGWNEAGAVLRRYAAFAGDGAR
jgi:alkylation response protein AidB-like acyl-CoA dehydrogenase